MTEILIDPNVRVAGNETFSGFEDVIGDLPTEGERVRVREPESDVVGEGVVTRVDEGDRLVYIAVEWATLAPARPSTPGELLQQVRAAVAGDQAAVSATFSVGASCAASQAASHHWRSNRDVALTA